MKRYLYPNGSSYPDIEKMEAGARADRARYLNCQVQRLVLWIRARLPKADPSLRNAACC
jgi:hypothetical protein